MKRAKLSLIINAISLSGVLVIGLLVLRENRSKETLSDHVSLQEQATPGEVTQRQRLHRIEADLFGLRTRLGRLALSPRYVDSMASRKGESGPPTKELEAGKQPTLSDLVERGIIGPKRTTQITKHYDEMVDTEGTEPGWSSETELAMVTSFDRVNKCGAKLLTSKCGASMCRAEIELDRPQDRKELMEYLLLEKPWMTESWVRRGEIGRENSVIVYFMKEGHPIPRVPYLNQGS
jgi:hypothetical protein